MATLQYTSKTADEIFSELRTTGRGLSKTEAAARLKKNGANDLKSIRVSGWHIFARQFKSPFIYLLLAAAALSFILREEADGFMVLLFITINTALGFYQEYKSERTLQLLQQYTVSNAKVLRDGKEIVVQSRELVAGDIIFLETGDTIPADVRFLEVENLTVDESALTGESVSVRKHATVLPDRPAELYQAKNIGFSSCGVTDGKAKAVVVETGKNTAMGAIAELAIETRHISNFEKGINQFSTFILRMVLVTLACVFAAHFFIKNGEANIGELIIFSIALAVSVIPEALPVVTTFSLSRGALHLAKHKVVVKRLSAIEDLGGMEILCTDKTGTLTENALTVAELSPYAHKDLLWHAAAATSTAATKRLDPFDIALWNALSKTEQKEITTVKRVADIPFHPAKRRNIVIEDFNGKQMLVARGAPEAVLALTETHAGLKKSLAVWIKKQGQMGRRVLAVAVKEVDAQEKIDSVKNIEACAHGLNFLGIISFVDPLKKSAAGALQHAQELGVQIKILTGDGKEVAGAVAREIGLISSETDVVTGEVLARLSPEDRTAAIEKFHVFARVSPEEKYRIIEHLQKTHQVGFLGEGINDAPALKIAGVSMVVSGATDIAREAADIVLLQRSLNVILDGVREGRAVFANTTKYIKATLASNFGNFYAVALASLVIDYLPMLPIQILLLNLLSDFPMIAISTDTVDADETRMPKQYSVRDITLVATFLGVVSTIFDFIFFAIFRHAPPATLQTSWFIGSILTELIFIFSIRTRRPFFLAKFPSLSLVGLTILAAAATVVLPFMAFGVQLFSFATPTMASIITILTVVFIYFAVTEAVKLLYYRMAAKP